ncbi:hypothetical protein SGLAM104S_10165 [Streptomyces glaucescens]
MKVVKGMRKAVYRISSAQKLLYRPIDWNMRTSGTRATVGVSMRPPRMTAVRTLLNGMSTRVSPYAAQALMKTVATVDVTVTRTLVAR